MKNIYIILALLLQVALEGCSNVELTQNDFVGIWKSPEGAFINLNSDGTCTTKDMKLSKFHYDGTDFIGKWDLKTTEAGLDCNYSLIISCDSVFFMKSSKCQEVAYLVTPLHGIFFNLKEILMIGLNINSKK